MPISGGADSSSVATIVGSMCQMVAKAAQAGNQQVIRDARRIAGESEDSAYLPTDAREFANRVFYTCYMASQNSSKATRNRAKALTDQIGSYHLSANIDSVVAALYSLFVGITGKNPEV